MYCSICGRVLSDSMEFCPFCGRFAAKPLPPEAPPASTTGENDALFAVLGFFMPLVGLILYLVFRKENSRRAKSVGKWALIGFLIRAALTVTAFSWYLS